MPLGYKIRQQKNRTQVPVKMINGKLTVSKYNYKNSQMPNQILLQKSNQDSQFYIKHKFSLTDLIDLVPCFRVFAIETNQIEVNIRENFTFGTDRYILRLPKSPDNQKRILYYSLLCYLFQMCNDTEASKYQQVFVQYVLNECQVILPFKRILRQSHKIAMPMMTTNQIKASFTKFINLLKQRIRKEKMVLEEINTLPQIDFVFMSIFQMYIRKNSNCIQECAQRFVRDFGVEIQVKEDGFILNNECQVQKKQSDDQWDRFFIRKIDNRKANKVSIELKRKNTTESVGQIDQSDWPQTQEEINQNLHYNELINARFVESCEAQDVQRQENESELNGTKKRIPPFLMTAENKMSIKKHEAETQICAQIPQKSKQKPRAKRTSFLNEKICGSKIMLVQRERLKKSKLKTQVSYKNLNYSKEIYPGNYRPWSTKPDKTQKSFNLFTSNSKNDLQKTACSSKLIKVSFCQDSAKKFCKNTQENNFNQNQVRFPQKRQTLQRLTFNQGMAYLQTL